ncbi:MAG TPA: trehalase family glycosidase, partial [Bryobacteraceae bacterium]
MKRRTFLLSSLALAAAPKPLLQRESFRHYVDQFNRDDQEDVAGLIHNAGAWDWMCSNIPLFSCPDPDIERTYYYRWWAYRKHIERTPVGYVLTEFLKPVKHATTYNAISCAAGLHISEGRWLRDPSYLDDYIRFWLRGGENGGLQPHFHQFSGWIADAVYDRWLADGRTQTMLGLLDALLTDYRTWEQEKQVPSGLFWQRDVSDGMESSISGGRKVRNIRTSINSYMYGNARAIAAIAGLAGNAKLQAEYEAKAAGLRRLVEERLWNSQAQFFETVLEDGESANVRELIGYTPWYFELPEQGKGYEIAWKQLMDPKGFLAPYGPTTAEQRHPEFQIPYSGDDCQWNGPSWPFATSITLRAMANVLNDYPQDAVTRQDYLRTLLIYTKSQRLKLEDVRVIPWIDEDL